MPRRNKHIITLDTATHTYRLLDSNLIVPGVTEVIDSVFPFKGRGLAVDRGRNFGSAVHEAIRLRIQGTLDWDTVDEPIKPYITQFEQWLIKEYDGTPYSEVKLYSKKYNYAGTIDLITNKIVDFKTCANPSPTHRLQIAAYRRLWNVNNKENKLKESIVVYLDGTDQTPKIEQEKPYDFNVFLSCLEIYKYKLKEKIL